ncbi:DUF4411 family protein [Microbacteriaceae bacterium VKM Ac-2854]|nr:DUF4411 family protein [Microbacteriaceae bacterium VKM Ac-2854]
MFSILAIRDELRVGGDELSEWIKTEVPTTFFVSAPATIGPSLASLARWTAGHDLYTQMARETCLASADYALVAHAQALGMTVVPHEASRPGALNRVLIPQACEAAGVPWVSPFDMVEAAGMSSASRRSRSRNELANQRDQGRTRYLGLGDDAARPRPVGQSVQRRCSIGPRSSQPVRPQPPAADLVGLRTVTDREEVKGVDDVLRCETALDGQRLQYQRGFDGGNARGDGDFRAIREGCPHIEMDRLICKRQVQSWNRVERASPVQHRCEACGRRGDEQVDRAIALLVVVAADRFVTGTEERRVDRSGRRNGRPETGVGIRGPSHDEFTARKRPREERDHLAADDPGLDMCRGGGRVSKGEERCVIRSGRGDGDDASPDHEPLRRRALC